MRLSNSQNNEGFKDLIPSFKSEGMKLGLGRIQKVIHRMGNPCEGIPAIQIVGTNGKGSIACFLESALVKAGIKTGCTTSPHLINWCERIRIDGTMISEEKFCESIKTIKSLSQLDQLTPFELVIASAFKYFSTNQVKIMILEAGLGGRLDATTVHSYRPLIAMAGIGLDHCEHLGKNIKEITKEKAAVISPGCTVISSKQSTEVTKILEEVVETNNAKIVWVEPLCEKWNLGIDGDIQRQNASIAKALLEELPKIGLEINIHQIKEGFASANWPGRLQKTTWKNLPLILDGAHNSHAIKQLAKERSNWSQKDACINWIIGIQKQKDAETMLRYLLKENDIAWVVPVPNHESWKKDDFVNVGSDFFYQLRESEGVEEVLEIFRSRNRWPSPSPVVTGSLYLIGHLLQTIYKQP
ncbi:MULTISPECIES: bifunctional folylpolyglutamate synthase/dihydrofolate synthase [unclassified Prochlorococcus]|uniref:bifunctional folylpolyglutamate synthase/dihydrofolate synthase n=1 Tax=unclassified Prochlorococcus TaxID=2627481 RepID=UPI000533791A|nr:MULTISPECIES: cyanophycin synthetase [unclassified Prochlorococcus]KGG16266.1 Dihydrofolate synthase [Prochlorococcus sp. MIT 0603]KGG18000.1 Dihydrofolate synthase [Prochlorococcus sp. MIT 0602]